MHSSKELLKIRPKNFNKFLTLIICTVLQNIINLLQQITLIQNLSIMKASTKNTTVVVVKKESAKKDSTLTKVVSKVEKAPSAYNALKAGNKAFKTELFSLSGAIKNYKKYVIDAGLMKDFGTSAKLDELLTFNNILENCNPKLIESKRFTVWAIGLAVNKQLKK